MKTLLFSLMILATLASCGKDNKVDSSTASTSITNPLVINSTSGSALVSAINNPTAYFGQGQLALGGNSGSTCKTVAYIINYCYSSGASTGTVTTWNNIIASYPTLTYQYSNGLTVRNSDVVVATKQAELAALLNSATQVVQDTQYQFSVYTSAGRYIIDIRYPIQMQPSAVNINTGSYYFYQAI